MRRRLRVGGVLLVVLLLAGCGLPVEKGVQTPESLARQGQVADSDQAGTMGRLPPPPRPGAPPIGVVQGFLDAQASPVGEHAIARRFLAPEIRTTWNDDAQVKVYDPEQLSFTLVGNADGDVVQVQVEGVVTATIAPDGSLDREDGVFEETYSLRRNTDGNWVLTDVPQGLRLRQSSVDRSYATQLIYYLAPGTGPTGHLVPEPALLVVDEQPAEGLVRRLVAGPSASLAGAVDTAVPPDTAVLAVTTDAAGVVTVDLGPQVAELSPADTERLSAQLVWTLRGVGTAFSGLRLLSAGRAVEVPGIDGEVQPRTAWEDYDPDGLTEQVTTYYVADRQLRTLQSPQPVQAAAGFPVDLAAVSPRTEDLALLTEIGGGRWEVRVGPLSGPIPQRPLYTGDSLRAPSWGDGRRGLWLLHTGSGPQVQLLRPSGELVPVPIVAPPPGRITDLRVSRDGARIALVAGEDNASRRVYVAPIIEESGLRIGEPQEVGFGVTDVSDVAWESATSVVALGRFSNLEPLPLRLAIDGSGAVDLVRLPGLEDLTRESLAWGPDRPLVVAATRDGQRVLLRSTASVFEEQPGSGYAPFYPG